MPKSLKLFLTGATVLCVGAFTTVSAFSAPKPDAPEMPVVSKPVKVPLKTVVKKKKATTTVIIKHKPKLAIAAGLKGIVIDEPDMEKGTISVVTDNNEFATIAVGMGTRITRGGAVADLPNVHTGYIIRCQGAWDQDGFQYQANRVLLGSIVKDTDVVGRVNAACENIAKARRGGGFGKSLVAMVPPSSQPHGIALSSGQAQPITPTSSALAPAAATPTQPTTVAPKAPTTPAPTTPTAPVQHVAPVQKP